LGLCTAHANGCYVKLELLTRQRNGRWQAARALSLPAGSTLAAFAVGKAGPAAVVVGAGDRSLSVVSRIAARWRRTVLVPRLASGTVVGPPGLALDRRGLPAVAYTRWHRKSRLSYLLLARIGARGQVRRQGITIGGFPKSYVAPPAAPAVLPNGSVHVIESYGISGAVGTIEWIPRNRTWIGLYLSAGRGGFPIGPMFAAAGRGSIVYAAWTEEFPGSLYGGFPVTLATHGREITENIVSERGVTTGLAMTRNGPAVAANEWVAADTWAFSVTEPTAVWAGTVTGHGSSELDGRVAGLAGVPGGAQDVLLSRPEGLSWFRSRAFPVHVSMAAEQRLDGTIALTGRVQGARGGRVTIYRERSSTRRETAGTVHLGAGGTFSLVDPARTRPTFYRAVYVDPATGIPYAKLLRDPVGGQAG
jgi:hypothetical protein